MISKRSTSIVYLFLGFTDPLLEVVIYTYDDDDSVRKERDGGRGYSSFILFLAVMVSLRRVGGSRHRRFSWLRIRDTFSTEKGFKLRLGSFDLNLFALHKCEKRFGHFTLKFIF